jgi:hypothetical protein
MTPPNKAATSRVPKQGDTVTYKGWLIEYCPQDDAEEPWLLSNDKIGEGYGAKSVAEAKKLIDNYKPYESPIWMESYNTPLHRREWEERYDDLTAKWGDAAFEMFCKELASREKDRGPEFSEEDKAHLNSWGVQAKKAGKFKSALLNKSNNHLIHVLQDVLDTPVIGGQIQHDPDAEAMASRGKEFKGKPKMVSMTDGDCHWNVAKLYSENKIDTIVIGYAANSWGWHQHTWGLKGGKIIETTPSNMSNTAWFGMELTPVEVERFVALTSKHRGGEDMVRTTKGGPVAE